MAFGFLGDVIENIGDVLLPRGTRGATIGGAIGGALGGPSGVALGSSLGAATTSAISSGQRGAEAVASPTVAQTPALAPESSLSSMGSALQRPTFRDYEGRVPITAGLGAAVTAAGRVLRRPEVAGALGAVGGSVLDITYGNLMGGCDAKMPKLVGMTRDGCPTVTRKQQRVLRNMAMYMPLESVAYEAGVDVTTMARLISKSFPTRSRGISGAQLRNAKRVNNQILNMAGKLGYNVTPKTKAQLGCK